jgi:hypothetical protein
MMGNYDYGSEMGPIQSYIGEPPSQANDHYNGIPDSLKQNFYGNIPDSTQVPQSF